MKTLEICELETLENGHRIEAKIRVGKSCHLVYFKSDDTQLCKGIETFIAMALVPCMKAGIENIQVNDEVHPRFLEGFEAIQDQVIQWKPNFHRVKLIGHRELSEFLVPSDRVGLFFSGGVDSFYSLIQKQGEISDLIFVHGFNISLDNIAARNTMSERLRKIADAFGKRLIEVETNARDFITEYINFDIGHGGVLAGVGYLLAAYFSRIYISASYMYKDLRPWGTHPLLDPHWSLETLKFIHIGCEIGRPWKIQQLAKNNLVMTYLHVCNQDLRSGKNCGKCEKCLRTMMNLRIAGALNRMELFEVPFDVKRFSKIKPNSSVLCNYENCLQILEETGKDRELEEILRQVIKNAKIHDNKMSWLYRRFVKIIRRR